VTIAAAYLTSEGVVLGADSTTQVTIRTPEGQGGVAQLLQHAQKVFEVGQDSRFGVCTWGAGHPCLNTSHRTVIARLADEIGDTTTVEQAAHKLKDIVVPLAGKDGGTDFIGYYLGGWDPGTHVPACFQIKIQPKAPEKERTQVFPLEIGMCMFSGMPQFFSRVFRGFDPQLSDLFFREAKLRFGEKFDEVAPRLSEAFVAATQQLVNVGYQDLPIREAIDFVHSYLHISIKALKFRFGVPACGGPIEIGFVTTDRRFRWATHKPFTSALGLELEESYHVRPEHR
jgi:hypothetical protein